MRISRSFVLALVLALSAASAEAAPIVGAFSIGGNFFPVNSANGALAALGTATGIDFGAALSPGTAGSFNVTSATGDFAFLTNTSGLIKDFAFGGSGSANFALPSAGSPILAFQSFAAAPTLTFALTSISTVLQTSAFLLLDGQGVFTMAGYAPTSGIFQFSGNGIGGTFSFSASNGATGQVPEPASLALLGGGLLVCAATLSRRRRRS